jgi:hypothetical protein
MAVSLHHVVIDAHDLPTMARFWAHVLGWRILLADLDAERPRPVHGAVGLSMRDHLEDAASLLEVLGDD